MATGIPFEGANVLYRGNDGDVSDLAVFANGRCIVSAWELTDEEVDHIVRTRRVFLSCFSGRELCPVFVGSEPVVREVVADYGAVWPMERTAAASSTEEETDVGTEHAR